jgi:LPXTG-site transpeptidase (sortase) family protein
LSSILDENDLKSLFGPNNQGQVLSTPKIPTPPPITKKTPSIQPKTFARDTNVLEGEVGPESKAKSFLTNFVHISWRLLVIYILIFAVTFTLINYPAIGKEINYFNNYNLGNQTPSQTLPPTPAFDPTAPATMDIPKIGVTAPIQWNVEDAAFQDKLLTGLVHLKGTALPGQNGNIFITGHSSYYAWSKSPYKDIFALLGKLNNGDKIYIEYNSITYTYTVNGSEVVSPDNLEVLNSTSKPILTLMTCVPIGTNLRRLLITADQS